MSFREPLLIVHILLLVAWLGIDVGVFYSSFVMRRPGLSTQTRAQVRKIMVTLDLAPRLSLILMIPVGLGLAHVSRLADFGPNEGLTVIALWAISVVSIVWCVGTIHAFKIRASNPSAVTVNTFDRLDWWGRLGFALAFAALGVTSLIWGQPFAPLWLALKALLFGLVILAGLWIRIAARRYRPALSELLEKGETAERLVAVNQSIRGVYVAVLTVWSTLVAMLVLAVTRP